MGTAASGHILNCAHLPLKLPKFFLKVNSIMPMQSNGLMVDKQFPGVELMEYLAFWVLCIGFCVKMSTTRGRYGFHWGILGAIFGPFAIALLLMIGDSDDLKKCPKCCGKVDPSATVCMHCRADLPKELENVASPPASGKRVILWGENAGKEVSEVSQVAKAQPILPGPDTASGNDC